jgi:hypothetical protein
MTDSNVLATLRWFEKTGTLFCEKCKKKIYPKHWMWKKDNKYYHDCCKPESAERVR